MVIWVTGLSASGKTTLCGELLRLLRARTSAVVSLDGDVIRRTFDDGLGYKENDRIVQIKRIQRLAKMLSDQGLIVVVAALYSNQQLLSWNREQIPEYFEIYMKASLDTLKKRDTKGLYQKALRGEIEDVVGLDIPWEPPINSDITVDADSQNKPEGLARDLMDVIPFAHI